MKKEIDIESLHLPRLSGVPPLFVTKEGKDYNWFKVKDYSELDSVCAYFGQVRHGLMPSAYPTIICVEHPNTTLDREKGERYPSVRFISVEEIFDAQTRFWSAVRDAQMPTSVETID